MNKIQKQMPAPEYHAVDAMSKTRMSYLMKSPAHLRAFLTSEEPNQPTPSQMVGTLVHAILLEPHTFDSQFVIAPAVDRRTKEGKAIYAEFVASNADKTVVNAEQREIALAIRKSIGESYFIRNIADAVDRNNTEISVFAEDASGVQCKARFDMFDEAANIVYDVKTCRSADERSFTKDARGYTYGLQAAHYLICGREAGILNNETRFVFLAVETEGPAFGFSFYEAEKSSLDHWTEVRKDMLKRWHECESNAIYPSYSQKVKAISI